jgi:hypothetical protein
MLTVLPLAILNLLCLIFTKQETPAQLVQLDLLVLREQLALTLPRCQGS